MGIITLRVNTRHEASSQAPMIENFTGQNVSYRPLPDELFSSRSIQYIFVGQSFAWCSRNVSLRALLFGTIVSTTKIRRTMLFNASLLAIL